ncbi:MAG TPA: cupin domain-containing protein [Pyrinomonadaceae bacterium]|nr:cupin domain-containing protein [Pyrinomonadaceae bacterium]
MKGYGADTLGRLLRPATTEEFLASSWGRAHLHVRGPADKFSALMPWPRLNEILRGHRLDFPRLRLARDGKALPFSSCVRRVQGGRRKVTVPRLLPNELTRHLREGATLVLDAVDEVQPAIEEIASGLEHLFRERVQVNLYAGFQTSRGFDLHWDDHDVFVLQVAGRKRWSVYGMTRPYPLAPDVEAAERPRGAPVWEETLEAGDLLYIPRGWWHVAMPLAEPTLHLTVGVHNRTGHDLLRWLTERMRASEDYRRDLPRFAPPVERAAHLARMREELLAAFDEGVLERYFEEYDAGAEPRPRVGLPWSASGELLPPDSDPPVRLLPPRPLAFREEGGDVAFDFRRRRWRFGAAALPVLRRLEEGRVCTLAELHEAAGGALERETVRAFVAELVAQGLVAVVEEPPAA